METDHRPFAADVVSSVKERVESSGERVGVSERLVEQNLVLFSRLQLDLAVNSRQTRVDGRRRVHTPAARQVSK